MIPNVVKMKSYGALQFLLNKKYQEKSLSKFICHNNKLEHL